jgi:hypothetical protein
MDLHNLFHFLELRLDPRAQWEIREYARAISEIVKVVAPCAWRAFERHVLHGCRLSEDELKAVRQMLAGKPNPLEGRCRTEFCRKVLGEGESETETPPAAEEATFAAETGEAPEVTKAGFRVRMSREEINHLPIGHFAGKICAVDRPEDVKRAVAALRKDRILGFDTESRPSFRRGESYPVSILQLAGREAAWVFHLRRLGEARNEVWELLSDPAVLKVGVAIAQDLSKLQALAPFTPAGFVDLATLATRLGIQNHGLRGLCAVVLGFRISKGAQRSNWAREPLTPAQLTYAATDAWAGREIYAELVRRGLLPAHAD